MEFFAWGSWLVSFGGYLLITLKFSGAQVGAIYGTMGISALIMPALLGIVADRWINAERVFAVCHLMSCGLLLWASTVTDFNTMYLVMLLNAFFFMPTIGLNSAVSFSILERGGLDIVKDFPPIRVWGTVGFICSMWFVDLSGLTLSPYQLYVGAFASLLLGLFAFMRIPACPPKKGVSRTSLIANLGLDAFVLFKRRTMFIFFAFAMLLGAALQITNIFGEAFLHDFGDTHPGSFVVGHPGLLMSVSQISETVFVLTIPFFLRRFGIKTVMMMSIFAWALRFGAFGLGDPGAGLPWLVFSMIIYGMAFDFFNISGSLFVRQESAADTLSSAQGLFVLMTNGLGSILGGWLSGFVVDYFTTNGERDWQSIWFSFSAYALLLGVTFPILFRYKKAMAPITSVPH